MVYIRSKTILTSQINIRWLQNIFTEIVCKKKVLMDFKFLFTTCVLCLHLSIDLENIWFGNGGKTSQRRPYNGVYCGLWLTII